jgi:hypothetical protein
MAQENAKYRGADSRGRDSCDDHPFDQLGEPALELGIGFRKAHI